MRCGEDVDGGKSRFVLVVKEFEWGFGLEATRSIGLDEGSCAVHINGDRECVRHISGYRGSIEEKLKIPSILDIRGHEKL